MKKDYYYYIVVNYIAKMTEKYVIHCSCSQCLKVLTWWSSVYFQCWCRFLTQSFMNMDPDSVSGPSFCCPALRPQRAAYGFYGTLLLFTVGCLIRNYWPGPKPQTCTLTCTLTHIQQHVCQTVMVKSHMQKNMKRKLHTHTHTHTQAVVADEAVVHTV